MPKHVIDVTDQTFYDEVLMKSQEVPVVVDLWADWCGPCKTLGPVLEGLAEEYGGSFILAKVDVDANQQVAMQMRVQSIPTVVAFKDGNPIDAFQGALPREQVKQWLSKFVQPAEEDDEEEPEPEVLEGPAADLASGDLDAAEAGYAAMLEEDDGNPEALVGLCRVALAREEMDRALELWEEIPEERLTLIEGEWEDVWLLAETHDAPEMSELDARIEEDGNDHEARYLRALLRAKEGEWDAAFPDLIQVVVRDREWRDDGARIAMVNLFRILGEDNPLTSKWRVEMGRAMYV